MLKRVHVKGYKSLADVEVTLETLTVLFGPNAAGKSNFLDARVVSEGTLRLLGLLALTGVAQAPALVGFEEPENGVHPRRIEMIAELLKTRERLQENQYIVTTHSPILPNLLPKPSLFVVRRTNGRTGIDGFSTWGPSGRGDDVDDALADDQDGATISERILRGDFGV